jgi:peptide deformylase
LIIKERVWIRCLMKKRAVLAIRVDGDPCLRKVSQPLQDVGPAERILIQAMIETMHEADGVGLAAPQVGINKRIIVLDTGDGNGPFAMINPEITAREGCSVMEEGCLSVPGGCVKIERSETITARFLDELGDGRQATCSGLLARAVQHECDHLDGTLITDYLPESGPGKTDQSLLRDER